MSRLSSPRESGQAAVSATTASPTTLSSPRPNQHLSPRPSPSAFDIVVSPSDNSGLSAPLSAMPATATTEQLSLSLPLPTPLPPPAALSNLPSIDLTFYSSTSLFAPYDSPLPSLSLDAPSERVACRRPRPFFLASQHRTAPHPSSATHSTSYATRGATQAAASTSTCPVVIRSYRRHLPASSVLESLHVSVWPHPPTAHSPQSRSTYLSLLPLDEQLTLQQSVERRVAEAARALLAVLAVVAGLCSRPYDLSLHRMRPNQWRLLPSHPTLTTLLAPFMSSLALLRDGQEWIVGEAGVEEVTRRVTQARAELLPLAATSTSEESAMELSDAVLLQAGQLQGNDAVGRESDDKPYESDESEERTVGLPAPLVRHKSLHPTPMSVRPMPSTPTVSRHSRSTFHPQPTRSQRNQPAQCPPAVASRSSEMEVAHSNRTEAGAHPKTLLTNVAGDRRTLPIALPPTFLSTAPTTAATAQGSSAFTIQPGVLELGPLLVGCTYTATLLLTNTASHYARYELLLPTTSDVSTATSDSTPVHCPARLSFAFRRGGLSAGLSKHLTAIVVCAAVGTVDCDVVVAGDGGSVRVAVRSECMDDEEQWRRERAQFDSLSVGELGLTMVSGLPGSLKEVRTLYGRVKEMKIGVVEEQKEQLLNAAVLHKWRNKPLSN